ncbi:MAG: hypothetical protein HKN56_08255 [Gammaproteobacteria bacterium]|nr:TylF/MycF family methyltransferase [Gammaproteobacteria bacterium]NND54945.1 hypothetical protein [Gammaproteobacteria bacterium]
MKKLSKFLGSWRYWPTCIRFMLRSDLGISFAQRFAIIRDFYRITLSFENIPHYQRQILVFAEAILQQPRESRGVIIEAGCFKGVSSAKFSLIAKMTGKTFYVFDSFQGIPPNDEAHEIYGSAVTFEEGDYAASLDTVQKNIREHGDIDSCRFVQGWFDDTFPDFKEPVAAAYLDVDLVSSTKTCIQYIWPLLQPDGVIYSQDAHLKDIQDLFADEVFWREEVGTEPPTIRRDNKAQLLYVVKPG